MKFIEQASKWTNGDRLQGKIMLYTGLVWMLVAYFVFYQKDIFLRATLIPLGLLISVLVGYGSILAFTRKTYLENITVRYALSSKETIQNECDRSLKIKKLYSICQMVWVLLLVLSMVMFFILDTQFLKGLSVGLLLLFTHLLAIHFWLQKRKKHYLMALNKFILNN